MSLFNSGKKSRSILNERWQKEFSQAERDEIKKKLANISGNGTLSHTNADFDYSQCKDGRSRVVRIKRKRA